MDEVREKPQPAVGQLWKERHGVDPYRITRRVGDEFAISFREEDDRGPTYRASEIQQDIFVGYAPGYGPPLLREGGRPKPAKGQRWRDGNTIVTLKAHLNDCGKERDGSDRWRWQVETENGSDCGYLDYYFEPGGMLEFVDNGTPPAAVPVGVPPAMIPVRVDPRLRPDQWYLESPVKVPPEFRYGGILNASLPKWTIGIDMGKPSEPRGYGGKTWAEHVTGDQNMAVGMRQRDHENPSAGRRLRAMLEVGRVPKPEPYVCPVSDEDLLPDAGTSYRSPR